MDALPEALRALAAYDQFILWKGVANAKGGVDKLPVSPLNLSVQSAHNPAIWLSADKALELSRSTGYGLGFVFTATDPFYFLDIDKCLQADNTWSPLAVELCTRLSGAAIEVSQSGRGLHIFGSGAVPEHGCKNVPLGLELYTSERFVALTGTNAAGNAGHDSSAAMAQIVPQYFPPLVAAEPVAWSDGPAPEWSGPDNDAELIELMLNSRKGAGAIFGNKASFKDLWTADAEALGAAYPDGEGLGRPWDGSSADMALCAHLAYYTGRDCARIERLFNQSELVRDKWAEREDYRQRTIMRACELTTTVYGQNRKPDPMTAEPAAPVSLMSGPPTAVAAEVLTGGEAAAIREGFQYLGISQQLEYFAGCVYVRDLHRVFTPDGALLKPEQFKTSYGGYVFAMDTANDQTTKNAWEAFTESKGARFPKAHGVCFRPEEPPGALLQDEGRVVINTYVPIPIARVPGDVEPFLRHVELMLPVKSDRDILLAYMAACVQHAGVKFQWTPLVQGMEGNGKTLLVSCLSAAIGRRYTHLPKAEHLSNNFNLWILNKLFIGVEEVYVSDRREALDALKPLITNDRIEIEGKGADQITGDNRANFLMCSNHKDAILKTRNDRRFAVFYTAQQDYEDLVRCGMTGDYFPELYAWLRNDGYAKVTNYLYEYQIPPELNPAGACHRAPSTSSTAEAIELTLGGIEQEIIEAISEGRPGFAGGWISSMAFDRFLEERRDDKRIPRNKRKDVLRSLGFMLHPGLPEGRSNVVVPMDGGKPRLYIRIGHPDEGLTGGREIVNAYMAAQEDADSGVGKAMRIFSAPV